METVNERVYNRVSVFSVVHSLRRYMQQRWPGWKPCSRRIAAVALGHRIPYVGETGCNGIGVVPGWIVEIIVHPVGSRGRRGAFPLPIRDQFAIVRKPHEQGRLGILWNHRDSYSCEVVWYSNDVDLWIYRRQTGGDEIAICVDVQQTTESSDQRKVHLIRLSCRYSS